MNHIKCKAFWEFWGLSIFQKGFNQSLSLALSDHATAAGRDGHGSCPPQDLQLDGRTLYTCDAKRNAPVVNLIITKVLEERVGDLGEAEALASVDHETDDVFTV